MDVKLRPAKPEDAEACGQIFYEAFTRIAQEHNFPPDLSPAEHATGFLTAFLSHPDFYGVVAEVDGRIVGSNFLDERASVVGLGPNHHRSGNAERENRTGSHGACARTGLVTRSAKRSSRTGGLSQPLAVSLLQAWVRGARALVLPAGEGCR